MTESPLYNRIISRLARARRKEDRLALVHGAMLALLGSLLLTLAATVAEELLYLGITGRTVLAAVVAAGDIALLLWFVGRPLLRVARILGSSDDHALAVKVGRHFPAIRDRFLDALEMYESREKLRERYSLSLIDASFADLYAQIELLEFSEAIVDPAIRRLRRIVGLAFAVVALVLIVSPGAFLGSLHRIANYQTTFAAPLPFRFSIEPGNSEAVRGQNVNITIRTEGAPVRNVTFYSRPHGQVEFDAHVLNPGVPGVFQSQIEGIRASTEYYAAAEDVKSDHFTITVLDRPLVRVLKITIAPPAYTRIPSKPLDENVGDISAYPGSRVGVELKASKDLASASIVFNDSASARLTPSGAEASGAFTVRKNATYHLTLKDKDGLTNLDPVEYVIKAIPDEFPTAEILSPGKNIDLTGDMKVDLYIRIKDDFGFTRLRLASRLAQSKFEQPAEDFSFTDIPITDKNAGQLDLWYHWDLSSLRLVPEDAVAYYVEVFDNDNVNGPKSGKSEVYLLRLPSLEEVFSDVSQSHEASMESMESVSKETQQLRQDIEDLQRDVKKNRGKMDWQQQKKAEEMSQRYEGMKKKLEETSTKLDDMVKKMEENKVLSDQTLEKYLELQKLMEQLNSPELRDALKKLQQSMQLSPEQLKQAMDQLQFSEEQFRQSLERTLELLKRIHIEQKLDEVIKRADELAKQQEGLRQDVSKASPSDKKKRDELAERQKDLQKQMDALEKETADLKSKMEEFPKEMPLEEMTKAQQQLQQKQIGKKMNTSAMQMQSGEMQAAQESQQQSEQDISEFEQQMQQVQQSLRDKQMKQIVNQLRKQVENTLELSKRQESLKDETQSLDPNSRQFRESAQGQNDLMSDLNNVSNALGELSRKTFAITPEMGRELGNAMRKMGEAMQQMEGRSPSPSSQKQEEAMSSLNRAAMMMQNSVDAMLQNGQSGMSMAGLMGRLGQMAGQQGGINSGTQEAMKMGEGQGLSPEQQADYQRLAAQQGEVQKSLKQLSEEAKNAGEYSRLLGDLDRIAQDMQEVQTDLTQGNVNPNTIQKQDRILSRLLESTRSMRERDYEKRRTSKSGEDVTRQSPADIDLSTQEGKNRLREEMLKVLEGRYTKDYEELIRKYFEQLEKEEGNQ